MRDLRDVTCYSCGKKGHLSRNCSQHSWNRQSNRRQTLPPLTSSSRGADTDYYEAEQPIERALRANVTPQERANHWLTTVAAEDDETKDLVLQELTRQGDFQNA